MSEHHNTNMYRKHGYGFQHTSCSTARTMFTACLIGCWAVLELHSSSKLQPVMLQNTQVWLIYSSLRSVKIVQKFLLMWLSFWSNVHIHRWSVCATVKKFSALTLPSSTNVVISLIASDDGRKNPHRIVLDLLVRPVFTFVTNRSTVFFTIPPTTPYSSTFRNIGDLSVMNLERFQSLRQSAYFKPVSAPKPAASKIILYLRKRKN